MTRSSPAASAGRASRRWSIRAWRGLGAALSAPSRELDPMGWPTLAAWMQRRPITREDYWAIEQTARRSVHRR